MKLKFPAGIVQDGWLTARGRWIFSAVGWFLILVPLGLALNELFNPYFAIALFSVGVALAQVVNYEAKAKQANFQAPFTNDPLGWRKAKQSYADGGMPGK